jgi:uncharacterized protein (TIGR03000 family)
MFQKALPYFGSVAIAVAAFLATAETGQEANAFPRVGGRGGSRAVGFRGGFPAGGFHNGGFRGGYYHGGIHHPYSFGGFYPSYNPYAYYGGSYPYYNPYAYYGGSYPYYNPYGYWGWNYYPGYYGSYPTTPYYGGTSDPYGVYSAGTTKATLPQISSNNAVVHVRVPLALAEVVFDGQTMISTGKDRVFTTPELTPGKTYTYTVTANWSEDGLPRTETRAVQVQAGQSSTVDFTKKS